MRVQVMLAGRAAEEMFFGLGEVSTGAHSDLTNATSFCFGVFGFAGFHPGMGRGEGSGLNLAVLGPVDRDPVQNDRISCEVRAFLAEQYEEVLKTLAEHRAFVEAVAERLMWDPVVDGEEMAELARKHGFNVAGEGQ
jgi:ATP-dependent Zn protease